ncbi:MAG: hypothetical protein ACJAXZ_004579 [Akkermansiaceae bacterium]|jgi:hypothetical protein
MSLDQLLMTFLEDEAKKTEAADGQDDPPAAEPSQKKAPKKKARRTNRLIESLEGLPTKKRVIIDPEVEKNPDLFRLLDTTVSVRLYATPATFTRELIERQTHVLKNDPDAIPFTPPLEPCLLPQSVLTPSLGANAFPTSSRFSLVLVITTSPVLTFFNFSAIIGETNEIVSVVDKL